MLDVIQGLHMKKVFHYIISLFILWASVLHAEGVRIVITQGIDAATPIAVLPFKWNGSGDAPPDIGDIISSDLRKSGKFTPLPKTGMPQQIINSLSDVQPALWANVAVNAIVIGDFQSVEGTNKYEVSYQLIDISKGEPTVIATNRYRIEKQWLRYAVHAASDEIFYALTGIKGAFRTRIAYIVKTNKTKYPYELRVADYDGYNQFVVHRSPEPLMSPAWSPDGTRIAYVTFESGRSELVMQTLSDGTIKRIASYPRHNGAPAFSPDGTKLAFALSKDVNLNLYVMTLASGKIDKITSGRSNDTEPAWFPDSQTIAYTSDQAGRPQVYKININGGSPERITWTGAQNQDVTISSDGKFMVMVTTIDGKQHIARQDLDSGAVQILTSTLLDESPSLAPNGTMILYSASQGYSNVLKLVSTDGRFKANVPTTDGQVKFPAWSPYLK